MSLAEYDGPDREAGDENAYEARLNLIDLEDEELFEVGYELDDPKHPTYHDRYADVWDLRDGK
jgi:hypothetical protein